MYNQNMTATALIVDDERDIRELLGLALERMDLQVQSAENLQEAITLLSNRRFDLCLTDMRLPDGSGLDLIRHVRQHHAAMPIAMITAYGDVASAVGALKAGAFDFVSKPVALPELREIVQRGLLIAASPASNSAENPQALPDALAHLERMQIQSALEICRHNKTKAAAHLGITFRALRYKMEKLGLG
jgi:two-component system response regulator PilR (NtrC family)